MHRDAQDREDIRRVLAGDPSAFQGLVLRHGRRVHDLARRMLRDAHEAEDAAQQAFLNAFNALARFDLDRPFRHWLLRITSNLCRNRLAARRVRGALLPPQGGEAPLPDGGAQGPPRGLPPEGEARNARVREALEALPERYRLPAILYYVHDLSVVEVAEVLQTAPATVKTWLHRGRAVLRDLLRGDETPRPAGGMEE